MPLFLLFFFRERADIMKEVNPNKDGHKDGRGDDFDNPSCDRLSIKNIQQNRFKAASKADLSNAKQIGSSPTTSDGCNGRDACDDRGDVRHDCNRSDICDRGENDSHGDVCGGGDGYSDDGGRSERNGESGRHELTPREHDLANLPIKKIFIKLYIPAVVAMVVQAIYTLVDRIFIARIPDVGDYAIGGVGIVMPLYFLCFGVFMLFGIGGSANISISLGKRDRSRAERIFGTSLSSLFLTMFALMIFFLFYSKDILLWYGATPNNIEYAHDYFTILVVGALWASLSFAMNQVIRAEGNARYSMISILVGAIANLVLDPLFIFAFNWGVKGAAYATILSQFLSFAFCAVYFIKGHSSIKLHPASLIPRPDLLKSIVGIGFSPFFRQAAMSIMSFIIYGMIRQYGDELAQSAYSIAGSIVGFTLMPIFAMNQALQPIIGFNYGAKEYERVKSSLLYGSYYASIYLVVVWIITTFFTWIPVSLMANEGALAEMAEQCLYYVCLFYPLYGVVIISGNYFTSIGKAATAFFVTISREFLMLLPMLYIIAPIKGLSGVWFVLGAVDIPCFIVTLICVIADIRRINRLKNYAIATG